MCRLNVNIAARNIREMALNDDKSSYDTYKKNVDDALKNIDQELDAMKKTGVIEDKLYNQYVTQMNEWGTIGMDIIDEIEAGNQKDATEKILTKCAPALSEAVDTAKEIQKITDEQVDKLMFASKRDAVFNIIGIIIFNLISICIRSSSWKTYYCIYFDTISCIGGDNERIVPRKSSQHFGLSGR